MSLDQKRARVFGVLYLSPSPRRFRRCCSFSRYSTIPSVTSPAPGTTSGSCWALLASADHLDIGTAVVLVPIMWRRYKDLSIAYVTARLFECTFILVGIIAVLAIITLRNQTAGASEGTLAYTLAAIKDWTFLLGPGWVVGWGNGLILGYMMYRSELVPRPWPWLGMIGGPLLILTGTAILFGGNDPSSTLHGLQGIATIPEAAWELFLGVYCTIWGFRRDAPILSEATAPATAGTSPAWSPA